MRYVTVKCTETSTNPSVRALYGIDRTVYRGVCTLGPSVGKRFTFYFDRNEHGGNYDVNFVTSTVRNIQFEADNLLIVKTRNSAYEVTLGKAINE